jgi:uncharacterized protein (TIGR01619 family)
MKTVASFLFVISTYLFAHGQESNWDTYLAQYEKGAGSTTLNMDLVKTAPVKSLPFIVITGVTYRKCNSDGFPVKEEFDILYKISDDLNEAISSITKSELAGTFTSQCERLDYIYVRDTFKIRNQLTKLYKERYPSYKYYLNIRLDKEWAAYLNFLFPNAEIQEYMSNQKVVVQLMSAGDKLTKSRPIEHWLYFKNKIGRDSFIKYAEAKGFKVIGVDVIKDSELAYQLHLSKMDSIDLGELSKLTLQLRKKAIELNGEYDGWESLVVKD